MRTKRTLVLASLALAFLFAWLLARITLLPAGVTGKVAVQIPTGSSAGEIGRILENAGVIRSSFGFRILARITGKGTSLKPGAYELNRSMTPFQILEKVHRREAWARWVTIPEGFTVRQIAERVEAEGLGSADRFDYLAQHGGRFFSTSFRHPDDSLEGYLFPDTYLQPVGAPEDALIGEMLACFERKVMKPLSGRISRSGMSLHRVMTLASLIEREAKVSKDRALISAVLHNRLRRNMRLECDATVVYALGGQKKRVYYKDLKVDSPYNTYIYFGLPPGPIANPGLASIEAALNPANVDYLYYVARPDGSHIFSRTLEEHQRAVRIARGNGNR